MPANTPLDAVASLVRDIPHVLVDRVLGERSLAAFVKLAWHVVEPSTALVWGRHLDAICAHLDAVLTGEILNLYIATPPGSSKSLTTNVFFPAWAWIRQPGLRFLCAANAGDLVTRDAVVCRRLIESDWYRERWGDRYKLTTDQNVKTWYENDKRGFRTSTTTGSSVTGKKGDILICDDPHDTREVESDVQRKAVLDWWDVAFFNRVNNAITGRRIIIGQRTHSDDLPGHVLRRGFAELRIPEEHEVAAPPYPLAHKGIKDHRTQEGELLRPERFGPAQVAEAKMTMGELGYAAQHQQRPVPREGSIFKEGWFRYFTEESAGVYWQLEKATRKIDDCRWFGTVDLAISEKTSADWTCIAIWADDRQGNLILVDLIRGRWGGPELVRQLKMAVEDWQLAYLAVESNGFQLVVLQHARQAGLPIRELKADKDKISRSKTAEIRFESGKVWFPKGARWLGLLQTEMLEFPNGRHDDMVDVVSYGCVEFMKNYSRKVSAPSAVGGFLR